MDGGASVSGVHDVLPGGRNGFAYTLVSVPHKPIQKKGEAT